MKYLYPTTDDQAVLDVSDCQRNGTICLMKINYIISHLFFSLTLPCKNPEIICPCLLFTYKFYVNIYNEI